MSIGINRKFAALALVAAAAGFASATEESARMSDSHFVFLRPQTSSFWHTATNNVLELPVKYPKRAASAVLTVEGMAYSRVYTEVPEGLFRITLPEASSSARENVFDLTLAFDDGTVRTARLGLIHGLRPDSEGRTRCIVPEGGRAWVRTRNRSVVPVPYGTTSISVTVDGCTTDEVTGLDGSRGWYALTGVSNGDALSLAIVTNGVENIVDLKGWGNPGLSLIVK
jgi:hypothetical protein